ncbi:MAG: c-type cytochrome [Deferribacteres bacterium]|nr:c-type cytochrome [candidate division KSB1 bacterium]MCB9511138.1 c-type cytochrome [Deferribacteres bacterium]
MRRKMIILFGLAVLIQWIADAQAQDQWSWPEKPQNLQILPNDWPGSRLAPVMQGFSRALGVRCSYCHVGEENQPLSTYDFASDANPNKERAREMLNMLGSINDHLKKIDPSGPKRVNMWCHTCHNGRPRPLTLEEVLVETYQLQGLDAALNHFDQLKEKFYGRGVYDFENENTLNSFGYSVLNNGDAAGAIRVFKMNTEKFPKSANVWDSLAEGYLEAGDKDNAIKYYKKVIEIDPNSQNAKEALKKLGQ